MSMEAVRGAPCSICGEPIASSEAWIMTATEVVHAACQERLKWNERRERERRGRRPADGGRARSDADASDTTDSDADVR